MKNGWLIVIGVCALLITASVLGIITISGTASQAPATSSALVQTLNLI